MHRRTQQLEITGRTYTASEVSHSYGLWEVQEHVMDAALYFVNVRWGRCTCDAARHSAIPCKHVVAIRTWMAEEQRLASKVVQTEFDDLCVKFMDENAVEPGDMGRLVHDLSLRAIGPTDAARSATATRLVLGLKGGKDLIKALWALQASV
jgi:hypothetical protein